MNAGALQRPGGDTMVMNENRTDARLPSEVPVTLSYFNRRNVFTATVVNFNRGGMCIESGFEFEPGADVYIRIDALPPDPTGLSGITFPRTVTLARVKWCQKTSGGSGISYRVGVEYY